MIDNLIINHYAKCGSGENCQHDGARQHDDTRSHA